MLTLIGIVLCREEPVPGVVVKTLPVKQHLDGFSQPLSAMVHRLLTRRPWTVALFEDSQAAPSSRSSQHWHSGRRESAEPAGAGTCVRIMTGAPVPEGVCSHPPGVR